MKLFDIFKKKKNEKNFKDTVKEDVTILYLDDLRNKKCPGLRDCESCVFSMDKHRCAIDIMIDTIDYDLSFNKYESDKQRRKIIFESVKNK